MTSNTSRWPGGSLAAVSITMDNMGEAAELHRGTWPTDRDVGFHPSVTEHFPNMRRLLDETGVKGTYFIEAWNVGTYPEVIEAVRRDGHEIAFHGWQHEPWGALSPDDEWHLFKRSIAAFNQLDVTLHGFRPPGGKLTESTPEYLRSLGFAYCSPAGSRAAMHDDVVYLPFEWQGIDAYYYSEAFAGLRLEKGDSPELIDPDVLESRVVELIETKIVEGSYTAVLFHPFLETTEERRAAMRRIVERVRDDERVWLAPCHEVAEWIQAHPANFPDDPLLDMTTWSR
jgi:peptidoglycan/xylan/chitin deacetylase (PgdA/CDA1 family)